MSLEFTSASINPAAYFDGLAAGYDDTWTLSPAGKLQREAVWRSVDTLIQRGDRVLDLGCGTGEDALHLTQLGAQVLAIDTSPEMVRVARSKGVNSRVLAIESIHLLAATFDLVFSDFGAVNCVRNFSTLRTSLLRLVRPGGHLALCFMGRCCAWEFAYYALHCRLKKAARRWHGENTTAEGVVVFYPSVNQIRDALGPGFDLIADVGVGITVPPSFIGPMPPRLLGVLAAIDKHIETTAMGRCIGDHRLTIFRRN